MENQKKIEKVTQLKGERSLNPKLAYRIAKRMIDITLSLIGLCLLLPFFLLIAMGIKAEEWGGTVFFKQVRVGKNGASFVMYKFRTMEMAAEDKLPMLIEKNEIDGAMFKIKEDPRITSFGKLLRKTSLDEFPQLLNVLKGEMSLIGPRPALPKEVAHYTAFDKQRLAVVPGCSDLWQVSGRNQLSFSQMVELDLIYIEKAGIFYDFKLMLRTILVIFNGKGAC